MKSAAFIFVKEFPNSEEMFYAMLCSGLSYKFDEEEDETRRNKSTEIMVHDNTTDFLSDSYSETEEVLDDDKEDGEGKAEYKEKRGLTPRMRMQSLLRQRQQA